MDAFRNYKEKSRAAKQKEKENLEDGRQREVVWEENRGTYNPAAFLMQFQASPWSSA